MSCITKSCPGLNSSGSCVLAAPGHYHNRGPLTLATAWCAMVGHHTPDLSFLHCTFCMLKEDVLLVAT